jgi:hypothetical protein
MRPGICAPGRLNHEATGSAGAGESLPAGSEQVEADSEARQPASSG